MALKQCFFVLLGCVAVLVALYIHPTSMWYPMWHRRQLRDLDPELRRLYEVDEHMQISRDLKFMYVHVPKTGGSTIEYSTLFSHKRLHGSAPRSHHSIRLLKKRAPHHMSVAHIRDPCERFVSAFYYLRYDDRSKGMQPAAAELGLMNHSTVDSFIDFISENDLWPTLERNLFHFRNMTNWLVLEDGDTFGVDMVLCQENWEEGIRRLTSTLQLSKLPYSLMEHKLEAARIHGGCEILEPRLKNIIRNYYILDSCLFAYPPFEIDGRNTSQCIGSQGSRAWFTQRLRDCKRALGVSLGELVG